MLDEQIVMKRMKKFFQQTNIKNGMKWKEKPQRNEKMAHHNGRKKTKMGDKNNPFT
jgi:hypothetical protein